MNKQHSLMWVPVITVAKVENAKIVLGLPDVCSGKQIRSAYLALAKKWHPDICRQRSQLCEKRFREISNAWNFLKYLMEHYRFSLREEDVKKYQEPPDIKHERRFGGGIWPGEIDDIERFRDSFLERNIKLTAENVSFAAELLGLLDLTTKDRIKIRGRDLLSKIQDEQNAIIIRNAVAFLMRLLENYQYVLTPQAIQKDQEDPLARHRRQFGNEPLWSGGIFDNPVYENPNQFRKEKSSGKFKGIC